MARLKDMFRLENEIWNWMRRIRPPGPFKKAIAEQIYHVYTALAKDNGISLNDARKLSGDIELTPSAQERFELLKEMNEEDWFAYE